MTKYKLIKKYPGCAKIGTIATLDKSYEPPRFLLSDPFHQPLPVRYIKDNPEFWQEVIDNNPLKLEVGIEYILKYIHSNSSPFKCKITRFTKDGYPWKEYPSDYSGNGIVTDSYKLIKEVVEKDYEILAIKGINSNLKYFNEIRTDILFYCNKNWNIHSVKRLSDGEVFTVGDEIKTIDMGWKPFHKFYINNNYISLGIKDCGLIPLKTAKLSKHLFISKDDVNLFKGDTLYYVCSNFNINELTIGISATWEGIVGFSTKEAAEEYILRNKPCLSMQDLKSTGCLNEKQWYAILDLVNHKLKL